MMKMREEARKARAIMLQQRWAKIASAIGKASG
jgi:hypothetical protein